jgi:hypothetical protein
MAPPAAYAQIMRAQRPSWAVVRVAIAVVALYAVVLQAILGGTLSVGPSELTHQLCLKGTDVRDDGPVTPPSPHTHLSCCTAAHVPPVLDAPSLSATIIAWPVRRASGVIWRPEVVSIPRAPPRLHATARAPPVV